VKGYTDATGSDKINLPLSEKRALAVQNQLVAAGVPSTTTSSLGLGSQNLIDQGKTKSAQAKNRRVEIEITVDESKVPKSE
jgi:outer membrane protein OmpA-like peptidoglycan-associated protein